MVKSILNYNTYSIIVIRDMLSYTSRTTIVDNRGDKYIGYCKINHVEALPSPTETFHILMDIDILHIDVEYINIPLIILGVIIDHGYDNSLQLQLIVSP